MKITNTYLLPIIILVVFCSSCSSAKKGIQEVKETAEPVQDKVDYFANARKGEIKSIMEPSTDSTEVSSNDKSTVLKSKGYVHKQFDDLLKIHVTQDGAVNYKAFKQSHKELLDYIYVLQLVYKKDINQLSKNEQLAFWINAYNALTIDLILQYYPLSSIKDINKPWSQKLWEFGDKWLSLNEIEHKILREMEEPRIHFAIVCASISCPKLQNFAYRGDDIDQQLTVVTKSFLADNTKNEISENTIKISKIFKWFAKDFKTNGSLIDFLNQYAEIEISQKAQKSFMDYNWNLNE